MEKFMKFTMYDKIVKNEKYREDPFRTIKFKKDEEGNLVCPNNKKFAFYKKIPVKGNKYERTEEIYILAKIAVNVNLEDSVLRTGKIGPSD